VATEKATEPEKMPSGGGRSAEGKEEEEEEEDEGKEKEDEGGGGQEKHFSLRGGNIVPIFITWNGDEGKMQGGQRCGKELWPNGNV
jgi:hypothetical protein